MDLQSFFITALFILAFAGLQMFTLHRFAKSRKFATGKQEGESQTLTTDTAHEMGLGFYATGQVVSKISDFKIYRLGDNARARNVVVAETELASISLFEFEYDFGTRKYPRAHRRRVALVESSALELPAFDVEPAYAKLPRMRSYFDKCQVTFLTDPSFDQLFLLHSSDAPETRKCFDEVARDRLREEPDLYLEADGNKLLICFPSTDFSAHNLRSQFSQAFDWFKILSRADLDPHCVAHEIERILATAGQ